MKVLIAEDDAATRMLVAAIISSLGHDCTEVADGEAAWQSFLDIEPDVVVTDRHMPLVDGLALCRRIREHPEGRRTSILLVTGSGTAEEVLEGVESGADDYLVKPIESFALRVRLIAAARVAELHRQLEDAAAALAQKNADLVVTARTDPLTGVGNRRRFEEDLEGTHGEFSRGGWSYAVAMVDVDHFKAYNDTFGHQAGDVALQAVAAALGRSCRQGDHVYRYGGEEFVILYRLEPGSNAAVAVERARCNVASIPQGADVRVPLTVSVGVAWPSVDRPDSAAVLAAADAALYQAKADGRNRVVLADDVGGRT